ncbi:uncharacterized protein si:dkey-52l18.4 isoform X2 [Siniperca chuatsi]|uniref:uncharacterized protein si:dkey-52l18.4 isoform X2 n=1 Tax=Siniperca chuatsi TaxID=119488 RepID=UPI001CE15AA5|nr:uncharacterized protein si:dkey-52l18.4 isoform X2 [Siniperca chuatsi]
MTNPLLQSDMYKYIFSTVSCLCFLHNGGSLSLSCVVQHCGDKWTGNWMWRNSTVEKLKAVEESVRYRLTTVTLSANQTQLILNFPSVNQLDEGFYGCRVTWTEDYIDEGHLTYVNVTAAVPSQRSVVHRVLVCAGASLCLPIILGLARCLSSEVKPQPLPRTLSTYAAVYRDRPHPAPQPAPRRPVPQKCSASSHKAPPKSQQKAEVVYADISQDALRQQGANREPDQATVYSSLKFS